MTKEYCSYQGAVPGTKYLLFQSQRILYLYINSCYAGLAFYSSILSLYHNNRGTGLEKISYQQFGMLGLYVL